jgi:hypothetical protein
VTAISIADNSQAAEGSDKRVALNRRFCACRLGQSPRKIAVVLTTIFSRVRPAQFIFGEPIEVCSLNPMTASCVAAARPVRKMSASTPLRLVARAETALPDGRRGDVNALPVLPMSRLAVALSRTPSGCGI